MTTEILNYLQRRNIKAEEYQGGIKFTNGIDTFVLFTEWHRGNPVYFLLHKNIFQKKGNNRCYFGLIDYHLQKRFTNCDYKFCINYAMRHIYKWKVA